MKRTKAAPPKKRRRAPEASGFLAWTGMKSLHDDEIQSAIKACQKAACGGVKHLSEESPRAGYTKIGSWIAIDLSKIGPGTKFVLVLEE